jgi:hypothetical protein
LIIVSNAHERKNEKALQSDFEEERNEIKRKNKGKNCGKQEKVWILIY